MEPTQKDQIPPRNNDIDLGYVLYKIAKAIGRFFSLIGEFFKILFQGFVMLLILIRANFIWVILGGIVGLGFAYYEMHWRKPSYSSTATVKTNFGSVYALYNAVDYLNSLVGEGKTADLSSIFGISEQEATTIESFSVSPVISDAIVAAMYRDQFMEHKYNELVRVDTLLIRMITFEDFKSGLTKYDYPLQEVKATCKKPDVFAKLQDGLAAVINQDKTLQQSKAILQHQNVAEDSLLTSALKGIDTLRQTYNRKLMLQPNAEREGIASSSLTILERLRLRAPELDLFDKMLALKDELGSVRYRATLNQDIVQVYAPFNAIGQRQVSFVFGYVRSCIAGLILAILIIGFIDLFKYIGKLSPDTLAPKKD